MAQVLIPLVEVGAQPLGQWKATVLLGWTQHERTICSLSFALEGPEDPTDAISKSWL